MSDNAQHAALILILGLAGVGLCWFAYGMGRVHPHPPQRRLPVERYFPTLRLLLCLGVGIGGVLLILAIIAPTASVVGLFFLLLAIAAAL